MMQPPAGSSAHFDEVADGVFVARYAWADANVTAIAGDRGLVIVDTQSSAAAGRQVVEDVRRLSRGEVCAVINTHAHWDHAWGTVALREAWPGVPVHAHEACAAELATASPAAWAAESDDPRATEWLETDIVVPDEVFSSVALLDLGDRVIELIHPGRGHTAGDLLVHVSDAQVVLAGDLVEESAKPWLGEDSWPMEWPATLDFALGLITDSTLVIPGHGVPVDRTFVDNQREELIMIAEQIRQLAASGVPVGQALEAGEWPWEPALLAEAVRRGYTHLPREARQLPLA